MVLIFGWAGIFAGGFSALTWYANPLIVYAWIRYMKNPRVSYFAGMAAATLCLSFMLFDTVLTDEAGHSRKITSLESGYWLWTASAVIIFAGNIFRRFSHAAEK